ncbi:hypothetical protein AB0G60_07645 [Streptomyces angustmyceticus]|uniref:Immunity protein 35 domain-containing protein n=1 Tax=Streptomyces angustmyceticus TaxID=285578 RepID=A0A5J4LCS9_9ACTN|nr:hypothetical protein [Streptomyces angustmyceticus]UAL69317.1 hypothetical protein K7396_24575 [Streptomyces angustmyceticus]GES29399.1 hypothetical protein San01_18860 [Streptomyces angustmyceticus]
MTESERPDSTPGLPPTPPPFRPRLGPEPLPTNEAEALAIGRQHFPEVGSPGGPSALFVHEFDIGYLVHASWPRPEDPTAPPAELGGSNVVISKTDGEVTFVPNFPPESAVELYHQILDRRAS